MNSGRFDFRNAVDFMRRPIGDVNMSSEQSTGKVMKVRCCIAGGGPAGMMLGYLLGRAGVDVVVLEKHEDFFRDFRGDTVHPSTLQVMDELGLIDGFLKLPHQQLQKLDGVIGGRPVRIADLGRLDIKYPFIGFMPQWDFLNFLRTSGAGFPSLKVMMSTEVTDLIRDGDRIAGVKAKTPDGAIDIAADLTIACDGRHSKVRDCSGLPIEEIGAPMDVLWFRVGRRPNETENVFVRVESGRMLVTFDRGDYWQCAYVIAKGQYDAVKARGLAALLGDVARLAPILKSGLSDVRSWDDVKLLTVAINRLKRWSRPGLLCIGDAAHAMSPVGGVGVNLAVQDAVATANLLAAKLAIGCPSDDELDGVRRRREFPVRMTQRMQAIVQNNLISMALAQGNRPLRVPLLVRLITAVPWFQGITARFVGLGVRPEHVRSPVGHSPASMSFRWQQSLRGWPSAPRLPDQHQTKR
jgi:2-polyprenyl-6-methoxyphenol hydroxylase-like FAD-dependent oxidoreductase